MAGSRSRSRSQEHCGDKKNTKRSEKNGKVREGKRGVRREGE